MGKDSLMIFCPYICVYVFKYLCRSTHAFFSPLIIFATVHGFLEIWQKHHTILGNAILLKYLLMLLDEFNNIFLLSDYLIHQQQRVEINLNSFLFHKYILCGKTMIYVCACVPCTQASHCSVFFSSP